MADFATNLIKTHPWEYTTKTTGELAAKQFISGSFEVLLEVILKLPPDKPREDWRNQALMDLAKEVYDKHGITPQEQTNYSQQLTFIINDPAFEEKTLREMKRITL